MSSPTNHKKRKAEGDCYMELLLEIKDELKATKDELIATKTEVKDLKRQLLEGNVNPNGDATNDKAEQKGVSNASPEESDISDDEESVANDTWSTMFRQLREHRIVNGNCQVSKATNPKLAKWVENQKMFYGNAKSGKSGVKLSQVRIAKLEGIGINWGKKFPAPVAWEERFEEVKKYMEVMRSDPPVNANNPSPLAIWVSNQRTEYRRFKNGRDSLLTMDQIKQLNDIGFKWKGPRLA